MNVASMTEKKTDVKAGVTQTIYRTCKCGETAHDLKLIPTENGGRWAYACRNCGAARFTRVRK